MSNREAIQILAQLKRIPLASYAGRDVQALQRGIEAMKWINSNRDGHWHRYNSLLPGETEE